MNKNTDVTFSHGPDNAEQELKKAYNCTIEAGVTHFWTRRQIPGVNPYEVLTIYKNAMDAYRSNDRLAAERWARAAKHLAHAHWHEAKISYLEPRINELPCLEDGAEAFNLRERPDTTADLLNSLSDHIPVGMFEMPEEMRRYISIGKKHLEALGHSSAQQNELLRAEHIKAAYEYGRTIECLMLAYETETSRKRAA